MKNYCFNEDQVRLVLPHRQPMLLVDYVQNCTPKLTSLSAVKLLSASEPMLLINSDGNAYFPPTLMIEALAQSSGFLMNLRWLQDDGVDIAHFAAGGNDQVANRHIPHSVLAESRTHQCKLAQPGDCLRFDVSINLQRGQMIQFTSVAVNDHTDATFMELEVFLAFPEYTRKANITPSASSRAIQQSTTTRSTAGASVKNAIE